MAVQLRIIQARYVRYSLGFLIVSWLMLLGAVTHTDAQFISDVSPIAVAADSILPGFSMPEKAATVSASLKNHPTVLGTAVINSGKTIHIPILMYHYIRYVYNPEDKLGFALSVTPDNLEKQLAYLAQQGYVTITAQQLYDALNQNAALPAKSVLLTFDDGYKDFSIEAQRIIDKYNAKVMVFIPTDRLGTTNYMTWEDLNKIANDPLVTIAAHTRHHLDLTTLQPDAIEDEVVHGKAYLERNLGRAVDFFAYPYGAFNDRVVGIVKNAGFKMAFATIPNGIQSTGTQFALHRLNVSGDLDLAHYAQLLQQ